MPEPTDVDEVRPSRPARAPSRVPWRFAGAILGIGLAVYTLAHSDRTLLASRLWSAGPVLPVCMALELARVGVESLATRFALGPSGTRVPWNVLLRTHVIANAFGTVLPAPRPATEATKATLFRPWLPLSETTASGATMQSATFVAVALASVVCAAAAPGTLRDLLLGNALLLFAMGVGLRLVFRSRRFRDVLVRRFPTRAEAVERFHATSRASSLVAWRPSVALAVGVAFQIVELAILGVALGVPSSWRGTLAAFGVHLVTASVAVFVPGQLGAREAAFTVAAEALGTTPTLAAAMSLFWHTAQLAVALVGFGVLAFVRSPSVGEPGRRGARS
ncbi:MAG: lysylphosphatidylglycerol synthase transmembrane domain-containing protein [Polyangiaceae bacterium]